MIVILDGLQAGNRSGTGAYTEQLVRWLPQVDPKLELRVFWPEGVDRPDAGGRVEYVETDRKAWGRWWATQRRMPGEARRRGAVLHYPASVGGLFGGSRAVLTVHDLSFLRHPAWFRAERAAYYRWAVCHSARRAARVIADSEATACDLREHLGIEDERLVVIPLGVGPAFQPAMPEVQAAARRTYHLPERYFLFMGTLEPRKNLMLLVEAWSRVADACELDLVLAGRTGWKVEPLLEAVRAHPKAARIHLPGYIAPSDQAGVLTAAEAFVWPSLYEGFGLPPLEAMACGTPVLTSNTSSLPEVVGDAALCVDPEDVEAIAEGMRRLVVELDLRHRLMAAGLERAARYTWRRTAERTARAYRHVADA